MQDKFAIGPVTFVQLVGLTASPRIPSARADGAVRAADLPPPSAAAGLGGKAQHPVSDIESSFFAIKNPPALGLAADPLQAYIAFDAAVDRPDVSVSTPPPKPDLPPVDLPPTDRDTTNPPINGRDGSVPGTPDPSGADGSPDVIPPVVSTDPADEDAPPDKVVTTASATVDVPDPDFVFDGEKEFGDDHILDFTLAVSDEFLAQNAAHTLGFESVGLDLTLEFQLSDMGDWGAFDIIDSSGGHSPEPTLMDFNQFFAPQHMLSATDAVPSI